MAKNVVMVFVYLFNLIIKFIHGRLSISSVICLHGTSCNRAFNFKYTAGYDAQYRLQKTCLLDTVAGPYQENQYL